MKVLFPVALVAALFASSAYADEISNPADQIREQAQSVKTRAQVVSELQAARRAGAMGEVGEDVEYGQHAAVTSQLSRAQVAAEALKARIAGNVQVGELEG
ncbi:DUF4148 domain-containing protein [Pigmentiphaga aceris]|nr:DUF4148 domain-containing protein [Pigmentiphaga aceris]